LKAEIRRLEELLMEKKHYPEKVEARKRRKAERDSKREKRNQRKRERLEKFPEVTAMEVPRTPRMSSVTNSDDNIMTLTYPQPSSVCDKMSDLMELLFFNRLEVLRILNCHCPL